MTSHPLSVKSLKQSSIIAWNVAGEFRNPNIITFGSNNPRLVTKAAFHRSSSFIWTLLYPHRISNLVKYFDPFSFIMRSDISGKGYEFGFVNSFRYL